MKRKLIKIQFPQVLLVDDDNNNNDIDNISSKEYIFNIIKL